jgi:hypothetical protein
MQSLWGVIGKGLAKGYDGEGGIIVLLKYLKKL